MYKTKVQYNERNVYYEIKTCIIHIYKITKSMHSIQYDITNDERRRVSCSRAPAEAGGTGPAPASALHINIKV